MILENLAARCAAKLKASQQQQEGGGGNGLLSAWFSAVVNTVIESGTCDCSLLCEELDNNFGLIGNFCNDCVMEMCALVTNAYNSSHAKEAAVADVDKLIDIRLKAIANIESSIASDFSTRWTQAFADLHLNVVDDDDARSAVSPPPIKLSSMHGKRFVWTVLQSHITDFIYDEVASIAGNSSSTSSAEAGSSSLKDNIFRIATWSEYLDFCEQYESTSDNYTILCKNYYLLGYVVGARLNAAMDNTAKKKVIASAHVPHIAAFIKEAFYAKGAYSVAQRQQQEQQGQQVQQGQAQETEIMEELGSVHNIVEFTRGLERFGGLLYARPPLFQFYNFLNYIYQRVMQPKHLVLFHKFNPVQCMRALLNWPTGTDVDAAGRGGLDKLICLLKDSAPTTTALMPQDCLQWLFTFVIQGFLHLNLKDACCRKLKSAMGPSAGASIRSTLAVLEQHSPQMGAAAAAEALTIPVRLPTQLLVPSPSGSAVEATKRRRIDPQVQSATTIASCPQIVAVLADGLRGYGDDDVVAGGSGASSQQSGAVEQLLEADVFQEGAVIEGAAAAAMSSGSMEGSAGTSEGHESLEEFA